MVPQNKTFSEALEAVKQGKLISREGWNGKGMFVFLNRGSKETLPPVAEGQKEHIEGIDTALFHLGPIGSTTRLPNLNMRAATGSTVTGWLASQTDLLAEDWCIFELDPDGNPYVHNETVAENAKNTAA